MKKYLPMHSKTLLILIILAGFFLFVSPSKADAATCNWTNGGGNNLWNTTTNWSCGHVPTQASSDNAVFNSVNSNANVTINAAVDVTTWTMQNSYSGTISQGANTINIRSGGWTQSTGTFTGGSSSITIGNSNLGAFNFSLTGGTFTSTSGTLTVGGNFTITGSTFNANGGTVVFEGVNGGTPTINATATYNNLTLGATAAAAAAIYAIQSGTTLTVNGTLSFNQQAGGSQCGLSGTGSFVAKGDITIVGIGCTNTATVASTPQIDITISGTGNQTITGENDTDTLMPGIIINKASGNLTIVNEIVVTDIWTLTSMGSGSFITTGSTVRFALPNGNTEAITGSTTFNNLDFTNAFGGAQNTFTIASATILTVSGTLTMGSTGNGTFINSPGSIAAQGNVTTSNLGGLGSVPITFSGSANQTVTAGGSNFPTGTVTFSKSAGTITLAANWSINSSDQDLLVQPSSSQTLSGAFTLALGTAANQVLTISGTLIQGTSSITAGTITVSSGGVWSNTSTGGITTGSGGISNSGTITLDGTAAGCGDANNIAITSSSGGVQRTWSGTGSYTLYDVSIQDQSASPGLTAYSSTNNGNNTGFTFTSSCPATSSAAFWKFDEGLGTTAHDSSNTSSPATGTLSGTTLPTWQTEDQCISGKCLYFDGASSNVSVATAVPNVQSVAMWVRPNSFASGALIDLDGGTHYIDYNSSGVITAHGFSSPSYYVNGILTTSPTLTLNQWNYVEVTTGTSFNSSSSMTIGKYATGPTFFKGFMDEVKLYNTQRTASQVKADYATRGGLVGASEQVSNAINNNPNALSNGLTGYWKMEDSGTASYATPAIVQPSGGNCTCHGPNASGSTITVTYEAPQTPGDLNVVVVGWYDSTATTITDVVDTNGNTGAGASAGHYAVATALATENNNENQAIYYANNISSATAGSNTVTVTLSRSVSEYDVRILEYSGIDTTSPLDQNSSAGATSGTALDSGSKTTTSANELIFGAATVGSSISAPGAGFTSRFIPNTGSGNNVEDKNVTSTGSYNATATQSGSSDWLMQMATFKAATITTGTSLTDSSGNGNTGTATNGPTLQSMGKFGYGVAFDGTNDYVDAGNSASLQITGPLTLSVWIKGVNTGSVRDIIAKNGNSSNLGYKLYLDTNSKLNMDISSNGTAVTTATGATALTSTSTWYHITGVYIPNVSITVFVNGAQDGIQTTSVPSSINNPSTNLNIGAENGGASNFYNSTIDEARVYNRALSPADVLNLANFAPGPVSKWDFEEASYNGTSGEVKDTAGTGSNNNGTLSGIITQPQIVPGKYGKAVNLILNNSNYVTVTSPTNLNLNNFTLSGWFNNTDNSHKDLGLISKGASSDNAGTNFYLYYDSGTLRYSCGFRNTGDNALEDHFYSSAAAAINTWHFLECTYDGSNVKLYLDGNLVLTSAETHTPNTAGTQLLNIGALSNAGFLSGKYIDGVKIFNYGRTQKQVIEDMNAGHPAPGSPVGSPVGWWRFDEGYGNGAGSAHNSGNCGATCDGTPTNMASPAVTSAPFSGWQQAGKFGKALGFDGTNDYVAMPSDVTPLKITGDLTLSAWVFLTTNLANTDFICKWTNTAATSSYCLYMNNSGQLVMGISNGSSITTYTETVQTLVAGTWYHVVGVYSASNSVTLYINGIQVKQNTSSIPASLGDSTTILDIGAENAGTNPMLGLIDEPKVYAGALTADQVKLDMNRGQAQQLGAAGNNSTYQTGAANQEYCVPGDSTSCAAPVGRWDFEEGSGTTANDNSGNGNTGTITAGTGSYVSGKIGKAYNFDNANTKIDSGSAASLDDIATTASQDLTAEAWIYPKSVGGDTNTGIIFGKAASTTPTSGWVLRTVATAALKFMQSGGTVLVCQTANNAITLNTWNHVAVTWDGSTTATNVNIYVNGAKQTCSTNTNGATLTSDAASNFIIGNDTGQDATFDGNIDAVRVFNYARSASQVAWDYNHGGPVAWYKMDDCSGTTIHDSSGNGLNGTKSGSSTTGTCTTAGTFWGGASGNSTTNSGRFNYAPTFNNSDDSINIPTNSKIEFSGPFSASIWIKTTGLNSTSPTAFFDAGNFATNGWGLSDHGNFSANITFAVHPGDGAGVCGNTFACFPRSLVNDGVWHNIVGVYDGTFTKLYLDGILKDTQTPGSAIVQDAGDGINFGIGASAGGQADDARLYSYPLTATQVKQLYNNGAVNFAPATGVP